VVGGPFSVLTEEGAGLAKLRPLAPSPDPNDSLLEAAYDAANAYGEALPLYASWWRGAPSKPTAGGRWPAITPWPARKGKAEQARKKVEELGLKPVTP
jgi:hypothetical protein